MDKDRVIEQERELSVLKIELVERIGEIKSTVAELTGKYDHWIVNSNNWRQDIGFKIMQLVEKVDKTYDKVLSLPCETRKTLYQNIAWQMKAMWAILVTLVAVIAKEVLFNGK